MCGFQQELASLWWWPTHQPSASGLEEPAGKHCPAQCGLSSVPCLSAMPPGIAERNACSKCHSLAKKWDRVVFAVQHPSLSMGDRGYSPHECRRALTVCCPKAAESELLYLSQTVQTMKFWASLWRIPRKCSSGHFLSFSLLLTRIYTLLINYSAVTFNTEH